MIKNYLELRHKVAGMVRWFGWASVAAVVMVATAPATFGGFLHITALEVEEGTYYPGDPVPMALAITYAGDPDDDPACYEVHVHLTPDVNFRTETDHFLHILVGIIEPGETVLRTWTQMMPGNLPGTFFVDAEVTTCHNSGPPQMSTPPSWLASGFLVETAKITLRPSTYPETGLISVTQGGAPSNGNSEQASISADGRYVAFASEATTLLGFLRDEEGEIVLIDDNPVGLIGNEHSDVFVKDHWTGEIERISTPVGASDANGPSHQPRISADGRWVTFHSTARNMVPGINNDHPHVYLHDRESGQTRRLSISPAGQEGNQSSENASVSADGRFVVFESEATNLLPGDTNNVSDIFLYDREAGRIVRRVNVTNDGVQAQGGESRFPRISADGRHIVFESRATNLTADPSNAVWEIYIHDRNANETYGVVPVDGVDVQQPRFDEAGGTRTTRLSVSFDDLGQPLFSDGHSRYADLSYDGRFVVFHSDSTQLFAESAEGAIALPGRGAEAELRWSENEEGIATIAFDASGQLATGAIGFDSNPVDGHSVEIRDGAVSHRFEFDGPVATGVEAGNVRVFVGGTPSATRDNLVAAINTAFAIDGEEPGTIEAVADDSVLGGRIGLRLTNLEFGPPEANQPIDVSEAPTLVAEGMSGATDADNPVQPGDTLEIDNGRTPPVTIEFYAEGGTDPTDHDARIVGVEIGRTAKETSLNLLQAFHDLGYHEFDEDYLPGMPDYLLPPMMENPQHGTQFTFSQGDEEDEDDFFEFTFVFVDDGPQFDPSDPSRVRIGATPEETRGNLLRAMYAVGFSFANLPAIDEASGERVAFGQIFADSVARGSVSLSQVPEDGHRIIIGDGFINTTFRFDDERELTEDEQNAGIDQVPPFEVVGAGLVRVYLVQDMTLAEITNRLLGAIQASQLNITAGMGVSPELEGSAILLLNNLVGAIGNVPIEIIPLDEEDPDAEPDPDADPNLVVTEWASAYGMTGGQDSNPEGGDRVIFYPENLLHPAVIFEFLNDLDDLSPDAHFGIQIGAVGATTEGNLLEAIHRSGLPWLVADAPEDIDLPNVRLRSIIARGDGRIAFNFLASNPDSFACLGNCPGDREGTIHMPFHGGTLTLNDGVNPPVVFEFTFDGTVSDEDHIPVQIAPVGALTRDNLINAINQADHLEIRAEDASVPSEDPLVPDELVVRLINENRGPVGDIAEGNNLGPITVTNTDGGGWNPRPGEAFRIGDGTGTSVTFEFILSGDDPEAGRVGIVTVGGGGDNRATIRDRIIAAIKSTNLQIAAIAGTEDGHPAVLLQHNIPGPAGNVAIQILTPNPSFTVRGMSGGRFLGTGFAQVYLVDRDANQNGIFDQPGQVSIELISITESGAPGNHLSLEPAISGDGRYVAFRTQASDLQPRTVVRSDGEVFASRAGPLELESDEIVNFTEIDDFSDIYVRDRVEGVNRRVSVNRFGEVFGHTISNNAPQSDRGAAINYDGRFIAFETDDEAYNAAHRGGINNADIIGGGLAHTTTNRNPLDFNRQRDIMLHDRRFPTTLAPMPGVVVIELPGIVEGETVTVGTPIDIEARVEDLVTGRLPAFVQFFANGQLIGVATQPVIPGGDVFAIRWVPTLPTNYQIVAVATDSRGRSLPMSDVKTITAVAPSGTPPTVGIINPPVEDERLPENAFPLTNRSVWPFVALVSGGGSSIEEVEFFIRNLTPLEVEDNEIFQNLGGASIGVAQKESGGVTWRLRFDLSNPFGTGEPLPPGFYVVRAVARDAAGNLASSGAMPIVVSPAIYDKPSVRLTSNRREFNRLEFQRFRALADSEQGQIETGGDEGGEVFLFANGFMPEYGDFDNPQNVSPFEWVGLAATTGEWDYYAVARDTAGNTSMSNVIKIVVHPRKHITRNPSDPVEYSAFVDQIWDDFFINTGLRQDLASRVVMEHYVRALENGTMTRGQVVAELMTYPDFDTIIWVIVAYRTIIGEFPTVEQLHDGIALLEGGEGGGQDPEDPVLGPGVPIRLELLVAEILDSDSFWLKYKESGLTMSEEDLVNHVHPGKTDPIRQNRLLAMNEVGRFQYLAELTVEDYYSQERGIALRGALILLLLQRDIIPGEMAAVPSNLAAAAEFIITRPEFILRFDGPSSFLDVDTGSVNGLRTSAWFGTFGDRFFNYATGAGWLQHTEHGWIYIAPSSRTDNGVWLWDHIQKDWLWTSDSSYDPNRLLYSSDEGRWLYYVGGSPSARTFRAHDGTDWGAPFTVTP